jgi:hypothetical protein
MATTAVTTDYSGADPRTGKTCHRPSHHKSNMRAAYRNARKDDALGLHVAAGLLNPVSGVGRCSACGNVGTLAMMSDGTPGTLTLELAHDVPQSQGGAVCWCSVTLQHRGCNLSMGDSVTLGRDFTLYHDARDYAAAGGHWSPIRRAARWSFDYAGFLARHPHARADVSAWQTLTPAGYAAAQDALARV